MWFLFDIYRLLSEGVVHQSSTDRDCLFGESCASSFHPFCPTFCVKNVSSMGHLVWRNGSKCCLVTFDWSKFHCWSKFLLELIEALAFDVDGWWRPKRRSWRLGISRDSVRCVFFFWDNELHNVSSEGKPSWILIGAKLFSNVRCGFRRWESTVSIKSTYCILFHQRRYQWDSWSTFLLLHSFVQRFSVCMSRCLTLLA